MRIIPGYPFLIMLLMTVMKPILANTDATGQFERDILQGLKSYQSIDSYQYTLKKKELLRGFYVIQTINYGFKKPFKVYLKVLKGEDKGSELIYRAGWNNGDAKVKTKYLTLNLDPNGRLMLGTNRHPMYETGLGNILNGTLADLTLGKQNGDMAVKFIGVKNIDGRNTRCYIVTCPKAKVKVGTKIKDKKPGQYYAAKTNLCLDIKTGLPIIFRCWSHTMILLEEYIHSDLRLNHLSDDFFEPSHHKF